MVATRDVFSEEELAQLRGFPEARARRPDPILHAQHGGGDVRAKVPRPGDALGTCGAAVHAAMAGIRPGRDHLSPATAVARLSAGLGVPVGELRNYGTRGQIRTGHLREMAMAMTS